MAKTKEGIVNIHGKEYKTVALRVMQFREVCPDWSIVTELVSETDDKVIMKALISHLGVVLGTGYAEEVRSASRINKTSALENAETSAIGRALAACGYGGTEYASADEVANAISNQAINEEVEKKLLSYEQRGKQLANHLNAIRENWSSVTAIKEGIQNDDSTWVAECFMELDNDTREALFGLAPTKGGVFTTHERSYLKSDEMNAARKEVANGV
jgi:hypothetical protein